VIAPCEKLVVLPTCLIFKQDVLKDKNMAQTKEEKAAKKRTPERRAYEAQYKQTPEYKAKAAKYRKLPHVIAKAAIHRARPEIKAKKAVNATAIHRKLFRAKQRSRPHIKAITTLRSNVTKALKRGGKVRSTSTEAYIGCTLAECREYIASQFQPGMDWSNWAIGGWHLDHIRPIASFDHTVEGWEFEACHYTNLQPLWATENLTKGAKWEHVAQ
jgi:hypothetical protein